MPWLCLSRMDWSSRKHRCLQRASFQPSSIYMTCQILFDFTLLYFVWFTLLYITLHYITSHYITLYYSTLYYVTILYILIYTSYMYTVYICIHFVFQLKALSFRCISPGRGLWLVGLSSTSPTGFGPGHRTASCGPASRHAKVSLVCEVRSFVHSFSPRSSDFLRGSVEPVYRNWRAITSWFSRLRSPSLSVRTLRSWGVIGIFHKVKFHSSLRLLRSF